MLSAGLPASHVRSPFPRLAVAFARSRGFAAPAGKEDCDVERFVRQTEAFAEAARDPHVGVALARWIPRGTYELVEYSARSAPTLRDALRLATDFASLMNDRLRMRLVESDTEIVVEHWIDGEPCSLGRHFDEFAMATAIRFVGEVAEDVTVSRVHVVHAKSAGLDVAPILGAPVRYGQERNAFVLLRRDGARPLRGAEPPLSMLLARLAENARRDATPSDVVTRTRIAIARGFETGEPDVGVVARAMGMSTRTLERRLAAEGTTYDRVRDAYRCDWARHLLAREMPLPAVARRLRFRSVRGLHRALARWSTAD